MTWILLILLLLLLLKTSATLGDVHNVENESISIFQSFYNRQNFQLDFAARCIGILLISAQAMTLIPVLLAELYEYDYWRRRFKKIESDRRMETSTDSEVEDVDGFSPVETAVEIDTDESFEAAAEEEPNDTLFVANEVTKLGRLMMEEWQRLEIKFDRHWNILKRDVTRFKLKREQKLKKWAAKRNERHALLKKRRAEKARVELEKRTEKEVRKGREKKKSSTKQRSVEKEKEKKEKKEKKKENVFKKECTKTDLLEVEKTQESERKEEKKKKTVTFKEPCDAEPELAPLDVTPPSEEPQEQQEQQQEKRSEEKKKKKSAEPPSTTPRAGRRAPQDFHEKALRELEKDLDGPDEDPLESKVARKLRRKDRESRERNE